MESIGEKLRSAREARRLSVRDVVKDTNINPLYIEALEEEDFDRFPSETYLIGFLRSYSEYLRLDTDEIIQAYKGYKIGESATPIEELTRPTRPSIMMLLSNFFDRYKNAIFISSVSIAALLLFWVFKSILVTDVDVDGGNSIKNIREEYEARNEEDEIKNIQNFQLSNDRGFILVSKDEAVQFLVDNKEVVFLLRDIRDNSAILELFPDKKIEVLEMENPRTVMPEGSPREVVFTLKGLTENRAKILVLLGNKIAQEGGEVSESVKEQQVTASNEVETINNRNLKIVFEAFFTQKSFVELYLDGVQKRRGFLPEGTRERWEATEYIQLKIGNAGGLQAKINGKPYTFGKSGQVANKVITWKKDVKNPNLYHIHVKDW